MNHHHHHVAPSTRIYDTLSHHPFSIVHRSRKLLKATSCIGTELLYVGSCWLSYLCSSMWIGQQEYVTYEFVPTSPAMSCMSASSNLDSFRDGWKVTVQLLVCRVLPPGLVQYCSQHSCVVKLFLPTFSLRPCCASIQQYRYDCCLEKNCVSFYRSGLTSRWPIVYG